MTRQKKVKYESISALKKVLVVGGLLTCLFGGIFSVVVAFDEFKNYLYPYTFALVFGVLGLATGVYIAKLLKPHVILNNTMVINYIPLTIQFSLGFTGCFILLAHHLNSGLSTEVKCGEFTVVDTGYIKGGYKRSESNILYIDIDGKTEKLLCKHFYWKHITIGEKVGVCVYESPIGFDNLVLVNDH